MRQRSVSAMVMLALTVLLGFAELGVAREPALWTEDFSNGVGSFTIIIGDANTVFVHDPANLDLDCTFIRQPTADRRLADLGSTYSNDDSVGFVVEWSPISGSLHAFPHVGFFDATTGAAIAFVSMTGSRYQLSVQGSPGLGVENTGTSWFFGETYRLYFFLDGTNHSVTFATWVQDGDKFAFQGVGNWSYTTTLFAFDALGVGNLVEENPDPTLVADVDNFSFFSTGQGEILYVPAQNNPTVTSSPLDDGQLYDVTVLGTYRYNSQGERADAEWHMASAADGPIWRETGDPGSGLDLLINGQGVDWLGSEDGIAFDAHTFSPSHVYKYRVLGDGSPLSFMISDTSAGDNADGVTVELTPIDPIIPAVSDWSLLVMTLLTLTAGTTVLVRRHRRPCSTR